jgi:microcystin degradation protein MlrC
MGGAFGGGKPDTSAAEAQLAQQRAETERMRMQAQDEKRDLQEQMASKRRAKTRGGKRMLLSDTRLNPELGVEEDQTTLGG